MREHEVYRSMTVEIGKRLNAEPNRYDTWDAGTMADMSSVSLFPQIRPVR
jgi:hypothetical protein